MLKRIDDLGRIVIPAPFRDEMGVNLDEFVDMTMENNKLVIQKTNKMLSQQAIEHLLKTSKDMGLNDEYSKGFEDALGLVLGKESKND